MSCQAQQIMSLMQQVSQCSSSIGCHCAYSGTQPKDDESERA